MTRASLKLWGNNNGIYLWTKGNLKGPIQPNSKNTACYFELCCNVLTLAMTQGREFSWSLSNKVYCRGVQNNSFNAFYVHYYYYIRSWSYTLDSLRITLLTSKQISFLLQVLLSYRFCVHKKESPHSFFPDLSNFGCTLILPNSLMKTIRITLLLWWMNTSSKMHMQFVINQGVLVP